MRARRVEGLDPDAGFRANTALVVRARLEEMRSFADEALDPGAASAQHEMRIAAKRLRYVLELTEQCLGEDAVAARKAARALQGVLGDIHDCDVMLPRVQHIGSLAVLIENRRQELFGRFQGLWQEHADRGTWAALEARL
jgi:CHAD domain-containing protein